MKRVTIYDVAKEANVSLATVSRVINGVEIVRSDTRDRVQQAIEKLGYKPNAIAQGLALKKTTIIGLVIPEASFTYTGQIINGLLDVAKIYKYNIMLHTVTEGISEINDVVENIIKSRVDGVIIYSDKLQDAELSTLTKYDIPIVIIGNKAAQEKISSVYVNIEQAIYEIVDVYLQKNIDDIVIIEDRKNRNSIKKMVSGASNAFKKHNKEFNGLIEIPAEYRSSYDFLSSYLKKHKHSLVLTNRDSQAMACINAAKEIGIDIPNEMEIICLIDTKYNSMIRPQLSSFFIPSYDLGAVAMRIITKMLNNSNDEKPVELSYVFTPRQTTK
ncbi:MAG: LacI family DNA-binding transcriptional regulator [Erysipelotrichaceae bacterium]|nr:LacI family DNA-binding transcriptional regulator [Erysipelotrichaceae bacterium]MDD3923610.1 LacI family DNA-binding transcriptional regulator [Erysipelotrichaceae bacterium]MDD4642478.1 LacI family DNA-binding transcriptional regulator [Erysipelotrichaceae bacterium]